MTTETESPKLIDVTIPISYQDARSLLCLAFESGGSNYWIEEWAYVYAKGTKESDFLGDGRYTLHEHWSPYLLVPFIEGCEVRIKVNGDPDQKRYRVLNLASIEEGMRLFTSKEYWLYFCDFLLGDEDGMTGDVFLQLCLFGKLVFG